MTGPGPDDSRRPLPVSRSSRTLLNRTGAIRLCQTEAVFGSLNGWHLIILCVVSMIPFVITVVSIARDQVVSGTAKAVWVLIALLFPWLGLILWFTIGRKSVPAA